VHVCNIDGDPVVTTENFGIGGADLLEGCHAVAERRRAVACVVRNGALSIVQLARALVSVAVAEIS
jgi:hypothetical protein